MRALLVEYLRQESTVGKLTPTSAPGDSEFMRTGGTPKEAKDTQAVSDSLGGQSLGSTWKQRCEVARDHHDDVNATPPSRDVTIDASTPPGKMDGRELKSNLPGLEGGQPGTQMSRQCKQLRLTGRRRHRQVPTPGLNQQPSEEADKDAAAQK